MKWNKLLARSRHLEILMNISMDSMGKMEELVNLNYSLFMLSKT